MVLLVLLVLLGLQQKSWTPVSQKHGAARWLRANEQLLMQTGVMWLLSSNQRRRRVCEIESVSGGERFCRNSQPLLLYMPVRLVRAHRR